MSLELGVMVSLGIRFEMQCQLTVRIQIKI